MSVRRQPNFTFEGAEFVGAPSVNSLFDTVVTKWPTGVTACFDADAYNEFCDTLRRHPPLPTERQRPGAITYFSNLTPDEKATFLSYRLPNLHKTPPDELISLVSSAYDVKYGTTGARGVYHLLTLAMSGRLSAGYVAEGLVAFERACHMFSMFNMPKSVTMPDADSSAEFWRTISPLVQAHQAIERIQVFMHYARYNKLVEEQVAGPVLDHEQLSQQLSKFLTRARKYTPLTVAKYAWDANELCAEVAVARKTADLDAQFEKLESIEAQLFAAPWDTFIALYDSYDAELASLTDAMNRVLHDRLVETNAVHFKITSDVEGWSTEHLASILVGRRELVLMTEHQLVELQELLSELMSTACAVFHTEGMAGVNAYLHVMSSTYSLCARAPEAEANYISVLQREVELAAQQAYCSNEPFRFDFEAHTAIPIRALWAGYVQGANPYDHARRLRSLRQFAFEPMTLAQEQYKCYHLQGTVKPESIAMLDNALNYIFVRYYHKATNQLPPNFVAHLAQRGMADVDAISVLMGEYGQPSLYEGLAWNGEGSVLFDESATNVKDSAHVPMDPKVTTVAGYYTNLPDAEKREILAYVSTDPFRDALNLPNYVAQLGHIPVRLTVKPEQKEGGRTITMEPGPMRRLNSLIQSNLLPVASTYWGSMMSKSAAAKVKAVTKVLDYVRQNTGEGWQCAILMTDFVKFGHTIPRVLTDLVINKAALFFGRPWMKDFGQWLKLCKFSFDYDGIHGWFDNDAEGDGQGMRNGAWQVLLLACAYAFFPKIYETMDILSPTKPISVIYFQDDHNLIVPFRTKANQSRDEAIQLIKGPLLHALERLYNDAGLALTAAKTNVTSEKFGLLGDVFDMNGIVPITSKAFSTMLRPPSAYTKSYAGFISDIVTVCQSATISGHHPTTAWLTMIKGICLRTQLYKMDIAKTSFVALAMYMFMPQRWGGLNVPFLTTLPIGLGLWQEVDAAWAIMNHSLHNTPWAGYARWLHEQSTNQQQPWEGVKGLNIHRSLAEHVALNEYQRLFGTSPHELRKDYDAIARLITDYWAEVTPTLLRAAYLLHPLSTVEARANKIASSATFRAIASKRTLYALRAGERKRFAQYTLEIRSRVSGARHPDIHWNTWLTDWCGPKAHVYSYLPSLGLAVPIKTAVSGSFYCARKMVLPPGSFGEMYALSSTNVPFSNLFPMTFKDDMARYENLALCSYALMVEYGPRAASACALLEDIAKFNYNPGVWKFAGPAVAFRDVPLLQLVQPVITPWASRPTMKYQVYMDDLSEYVDKRNAHCNYGAIRVIALLQLEESESFLMTEGAIWRSPQLCEGVAQYLSRKYTAPTVNKQIEALLQLKGGSVVRQIEEVHGKQTYEELFMLGLALEAEMDRERKSGQPRSAIVEEPSVAIIDYFDIHGVMSGKEKSKALWKAWVMEVYYEHIAAGVPVATLLIEVPTSFSHLMNLDNDLTSKLERLAPTVGQCNALVRMARMWDCENAMLVWCRRIWVSIFGAALPLCANDLGEFMRHLCIRAPSTYMRELRRVTAALPHMPYKRDDITLSKRYRTLWADRLAARARDVGHAWSSYKLAARQSQHIGRRGFSKTVPIPDGAMEVYSATLIYNTLAVIHHTLAANEELLRKAANPTAVWQRFMSAIIEHYRSKYTARHKRTYTVAELIQHASARGNKNWATAWGKAINVIENRLTDVWHDYKFKVPFSKINLHSVQKQAPSWSWLKEYDVDPEQVGHEFDLVAQELLAGEFDPTRLRGILKTTVKSSDARAQAASDAVHRRKKKLAQRIRAEERQAQAARTTDIIQAAAEDIDEPIELAAPEEELAEGEVTATQGQHVPPPLAAMPTGSGKEEEDDAAFAAAIMAQTQAYLAGPDEPIEGEEPHSNIAWFDTSSNLINPMPSTPEASAQSDDFLDQFTLRRPTKLATMQVEWSDDDL